MTTDKFVPLGGDLSSEESPKFVRIAGPGDGDDDSPPPTPAVTPAEANDLPGQIRQILQEHLSGIELKNAAAEIQSAIEAAPARILLPEIKLTPAGESSSEPDAQPTIELVREENRVRQIILNCSCGQSIRMDCDY